MYSLCFMSAGVVFTEHSKPQFCPERKLDIDQFLILKDELKNSKHFVHSRNRTIGDSADIANHLTRKTDISCKLKKCIYNYVNLFNSGS